MKRHRWAPVDREADRCECCGVMARRTTRAELSLDGGQTWHRERDARAYARCDRSDMVAERQRAARYAARDRRRKAVLGRECKVCSITDSEATWSHYQGFCNACRRAAWRGETVPRTRPPGCVDVVLLAPRDDRQRTLYRVLARRNGGNAVRVGGQWHQLADDEDTCVIDCADRPSLWRMVRR